MNYMARIDKLRNFMVKSDLDLTIVLAGPNMYYLSGYTAISLERLITLLIFKDTSEIFLIIPELEKNRVEEMIGVKSVNIYVYPDNIDPIKKLMDIVLEKKVSSIGLEGSVPYRYVAGMKKHKRNIKFRIIDDILYRLRMIKDDDEIELLRRAAEINMRVMVEAISNINEGITEKKLMGMIRSLSIELGADETPFTLVQSGPNSALPHQEPTNRKIMKGDIVLLDLGISYKGYISDITRTIVVGKYNGKHETIFNIVRKAQAEALSIIKPGIGAGKIDQAARDVISKYGYDKFFIHRTGHGIGLEVHEEPYIKVGNDLSLQPGMTFTVEPGIYLPNEFGVRIEDNIVITKNGYLNLTTLPKSLNIQDYI